MAGQSLTVGELAVCAANSIGIAPAKYPKCDDYRTVAKNPEEALKNLSSGKWKPTAGRDDLVMAALERLTAAGQPGYNRNIEPALRALLKDNTDLSRKVADQLLDKSPLTAFHLADALNQKQFVDKSGKLAEVVRTELTKGKNIVNESNVDHDVKIETLKGLVDWVIANKEYAKTFPEAQAGVKTAANFSPSDASRYVLKKLPELAQVFDAKVIEELKVAANK